MLPPNLRSEPIRRPLPKRPRLRHHCPHLSIRSYPSAANAKRNSGPSRASVIRILAVQVLVARLSITRRRRARPRRNLPNAQHPRLSIRFLCLLGHLDNRHHPPPQRRGSPPIPGHIPEAHRKQPPFRRLIFSRTYRHARSHQECSLPPFHPAARCQAVRAECVCACRRRRAPRWAPVHQWVRP